MKKGEIIQSKIKVKHPIEYEMFLGRPILVLKRNWQGIKRDRIPKTEKCPFCGAYHLHRYGDGHRASHCTQPPIISCIADDGTILFSDDGYI